MTPEELNPSYPLSVRFKGGRVRHLAREVAIGVVSTACKKRRPVVDAGDDLPLCADCSTRIDGMTPAEAALSTSKANLVEFEADKADYCRAVAAEGCGCSPHHRVPGALQPNRWCREHGILKTVPAELTQSVSGIRGGEPCMLNTRVPVEQVSTLLDDGATWDLVKETHPSIPTPTSGMPHAQDAGLVEVRTAVRQPHMMALANLVHDAQQDTHPLADAAGGTGPYIVNGCVVNSAQQLKDSIHTIWKRVPVLLDELESKRATAGVLGDVAAERAAQDAKFGAQNHADGTGPDLEPLQRTDINLDLRTGAELAEIFRHRCQSNEVPNWRDILLEEVFEALAEDDAEALRTELIQVAAVAVNWVEALDRRTRTEPEGR